MKITLLFLILALCLAFATQAYSLQCGPNEGVCTAPGSGKLACYDKSTYYCCKNSVMCKKGDGCCGGHCYDTKLYTCSGNKLAPVVRASLTTKKEYNTRRPVVKEYEATKPAAKPAKTYTPKSTKTYAPKSSKTYAPKAKQTYTPKATKEYSPKKTYAPKSEKTYTPKPAKTYAPKVTKTYAPKAAKEYAPKKTYAPKPEKTYTPKAAKTYAPKPEKTYTPKAAKQTYGANGKAKKPTSSYNGKAKKSKKVSEKHMAPKKTYASHEAKEHENHSGARKAKILNKLKQLIEKIKASKSCKCLAKQLESVNLE